MSSNALLGRHDPDPFDDVRGELLRWAQREYTYSIGSREYERVRYGDEATSDASPPSACRDCGAMPGELHVPTCCWEQCPRCGGQAVSCECWNNALLDPTSLTSPTVARKQRSAR